MSPIDQSLRIMYMQYLRKYYSYVLKARSICTLPNIPLEINI